MYSQPKRLTLLPPPQSKRTKGTTPASLDANSLVQLDGHQLTLDDQSVISFLCDPYNPEFWSQTLERVSYVPINDSVRYIYEACLRLFPLSVKCWKAYLEHEIKYHQHSHTKDLFDRCLHHVLHVDIYTLYIDFIRNTQKGQEDEVCFPFCSIQTILWMRGTDDPHLKSYRVFVVMSTVVTLVRSLPIHWAT